MFIKISQITSLEITSISFELWLRHYDFVRVRKFQNDCCLQLYLTNCTSYNIYYFMFWGFFCLRRFKFEVVKRDEDILRVNITSGCILNQGH